MNNLRVFYHRIARRPGQAGDDAEEATVAPTSNERDTPTSHRGSNNVAAGGEVRMDFEHALSLDEERRETIQLIKTLFLANNTILMLWLIFTALAISPAAIAMDSVTQLPIFLYICMLFASLLIGYVAIYVPYLRKFCFCLYITLMVILLLSRLILSSPESSPPGSYSSKNFCYDFLWLSNIYLAIILAKKMPIIPWLSFPLSSSIIFELSSRF